MTRILLLWLLIGCAACGVEPAPPVPADGAREALQDAAPDWYDPPQDDWRRVEIHQRPEREFEFSLGSPGAAMSVLPMILYGLIIAALVALVVWLVSTARTLPQRDLRRRPGERQPTAALSDLPFDVIDTDDPEGALERAMAAGDHRSALIWIHACLLLRLDAIGRIRLHRSKTNRCYLRELPEEDPIHPLLRRTVRAFEAVYFGDQPADGPAVLALHADYRRLAAEPELA